MVPAEVGQRGGPEEAACFATAHSVESDQQNTPGYSVKMTKPQPLFICILCDSHSLGKGKCRALFVPVDFWLVIIQNVLESLCNYSEINLESWKGHNY